MLGLVEGGVSVLDCGLVPTPALLCAVKESKASAGVVVTGSHTPSEIGGVLFFLSDTGEMGPSDERIFEKLYWSKTSGDKVGGKNGSISSVEILDDYVRLIEKQLGNIGGYKVVVDPGNGATYATLNRVLEGVGCKIVTINGRPDGRFPARSPNPQPSTLTQLSRAVKRTKADLGVGTDSDGDRAVFATEQGDVLWADLTGAIFAKDEWQKNRGGVIISTVNTSCIMSLLCRKYEGSLKVTRVGPPAIAEALRSTENAIFATEESGKHIWPKILLYGDAAVASGKLLQIMKTQGLTLGQLRNGLPRLYQVKTAIQCSDQLKGKAMEFVNLSCKSKGLMRTSTIDGLKVEYPDSSWFLVRASGTEPLLRCNAEAKNLERARELLGRATKLALHAIKNARESQET
jgi:phosphomannomutase